MADTNEIPSHQSEEELLGLRPKATFDSSAVIGKTWKEKIKNQSLFSARTTSKSYLEMLRKKLAEIASRSVIPSVAEESLRNALKDLGYRPETGFPNNRGEVPPAKPGSITDLSSSRRIGLIIDTNIKQARSMGQLASSENPVFLMTNPAWRLTRTGARKKPRGDWKKRWIAAGNSVGWKGASKTQMVALKTSPIWKALGDGVGGYTDAISSAFPPFAFGSGLAWVNVGRREWKRICEAEGLENGLDEIKSKAISASTSERKNQKRFFGNAKAKDTAYEELRRSISEAVLVESDIKNGIARIEKAKAQRSGELADAYQFKAEIDRQIEELAKARNDIAAVRFRMDGFVDSINKEPNPKNQNEQAAFDSKMRSISEGARNARTIIVSAGVTAKSKITKLMSLLRGDITED